MRLGRLDLRASILSLSADLDVIQHGGAWVGVVAKDGGDVQAARGLRTGALVLVRSRPSKSLLQGRYLRVRERLLVITSVRDPMGRGAEAVMSCEELVGQPAQYLPADGVPRCCRVHLTHEAPYRDELGQDVSYMTRAEVAIIEVGRPQEGDQLRVEGDLYVVANYAGSSDDGVVRGLWLLPVD